MIVLKILAAPVMVALSLLAAMVTFLFCVASAVCELGCIVLTLLSLILFIGAIMSIDSSLYEAAEIDGANKWQQFKHIILPGIQTILVLNIILSITGSLSAFEGPYVITSGANGTGTYMVQMDKIAHTDQKVGLASAMAVILLIIIIICTLLQKIVMGFLFRDADDGTAKARKQAKKADKARRRAMKAANKVQAGKAPLFKNGKVSA